METRYIILIKQRTTKVLIRLRGCTGWSKPLLYAYGINRFSHGVAHLVLDHRLRLELQSCLIQLHSGWFEDDALNKNFWKTLEPVDKMSRIPYKKINDLARLFSLPLSDFIQKSVLFRLNSVSSQCACGKLSLVWKPEVHPKYFKW